MSEQAIGLTQYSHGAGCGCKISPKVLETILHSEQAKFVDPNLLVGNETRDDAAVYDLGNGTWSSAPPISLCRLSIIRLIWPRRRHQRHQRYFRYGRETDYGDCHPRLANQHPGAGNRPRSGGGRALCLPAGGDRAGGGALY